MLPDLAAALLFAWGYLLVRRTVPHASPCLGEEDAHARAAIVHQSFVVVIDGLRWGDAPAALEPLTAQAGAWGPVRVLAPPPTATLPVIKSLLTGAPPAFADVGAGVVFASARPTTEDTWVARLRACVPGMRVAAFGDAVWESLVGAGGFDQGSWSIPVLDVASDDDSAVWASLASEAASPTTTVRVAIGHVNALDHAQHVGGAGSAPARAALAAVTSNVTRLVAALTTPTACAAAGTAGDTLLLVLGDHGCTRSGNHGGASRDERETALAALSVRAACAGGGGVPSSPPPGAIATADIAPTLALLHGAPSPFSSVGRVPAGMWQLFDNSSYPGALAANAAQVRRYLAAAPWAVGRAAGPGLSARLEGARTLAQTEAALGAVAAAAARHHAQFGWVRMGVGLAGLVGMAAWRVAGVVADGGPTTIPLLLIALHAASLFSVSCLQAEGWVVAGLEACLAVWAGRRRGGRQAAAVALIAMTASALAFLPRTSRTAAEAMHQAAIGSSPAHTALPWALAAVQAAALTAGGPPAAATAAALTLASAEAFHASGHVPEVAGLRMDLTAGLSHTVAVAVVAADTLTPFVVAGAAAALAGPRVAAAHAAARATTLAAAAASAALQARHILAPSVFAPRFVFELSFYVSAAVGGVVVGRREAKTKRP